MLKFKEKIKKNMPDANFIKPVAIWIFLLLLAIKMILCVYGLCTLHP
ncbi:hypothetical protein [Pedobacter sp. KBW06]|nr:hypothetical protein [Pedobacter sp. KBW06]